MLTCPSSSSYWPPPHTERTIGADAHVRAFAASAMSPAHTQVIRGARLRAPKGFRLLHPPTAFGLPPETGAMVFTVDGRWPRRHLISSATTSLLASFVTPRRVGATPIEASALARLILDGLLEVELDGRFQSGGAAHRRLFASRRTVARPSLVQKLSTVALQQTAVPIGHDASQIADRLYQANTLPRSPYWMERCPDDVAATSLLTPRGGDSRLHTRRSGPWLVWERLRRPRPRPSPMAAIFKLYVSTTPDATSEAAAALLRTLSFPRGPFSCKLGQDLASVLRPDRLVAYFEDRTALEATADRLRQNLSGYPAQGVPFTAPIGDDGLLSWGADLEHTTAPGSHARERSWRGWVTSRLATAISTAHQSGAADPVAFALDRVTLDGVLVRRWAPAAGLLRRHAMRENHGAA
jgi:hypothetical protein